MSYGNDGNDPRCLPNMWRDVPNGVLTLSSVLGSRCCSCGFGSLGCLQVHDVIVVTLAWNYPNP